MRARALLDQAAGLPRSVEPARDLWPEIAARIRRRKVVPIESRRRTWSRWAAWAAAAAVLVAVSSTVTAILLSRHVASTAARAVREMPPPDPALVGLQPWELEYLRAMGALRATLEDVRTSLPQEASARLEANLRIVDEAIREARAAWERDPDSRTLSEMLSASYRRKLELLRQAARLSAET